jgi:hypothetical protein
MVRFRPTRGNSGLKRRRVGLDHVDSDSMGGIVINSCCYGPRHCVMGQVVAWALACFWVAFSQGVRASVPAGCSPRACGGVGILFQRLYAGYASSWSVLGYQPGCCWGLGWFLGCLFPRGAREHTCRV